MEIIAAASVPSYESSPVHELRNLTPRDPSAEYYQVELWQASKPGSCQCQIWIFEQVGERTSWCCVGSPSWGLSKSSAASSSISVVSVPFEVTGEGPTKSLGLSNWLGLDDILLAELGRREPEPVADCGEDLSAGISKRPTGIRQESRTHTEAEKEIKESLYSQTSHLGGPCCMKDCSLSSGARALRVTW